MPAHGIESTVRNPHTMTGSTMVEHPRIPLRNPAAAAALAFLVPGAGHLYQGRRFKAILYFLCIWGTYFCGLAIGGLGIVEFRWEPGNRSYSYLSQIFAGLPALPAFFREPMATEQLFQLHRELGTQYEFALILTCIAGLLNILAIWDAFKGPAYGYGDE